MTADDLVVVDIADELADLRERAALLDSYRELAQVAVDRLAEQTAEIERLRRRIAGLVAELRERAAPTNGKGT